MRTIELNGQWTIGYGDTKRRPIQVPGVVESVAEDRGYPGPYEYRRSFELYDVEEGASYVLRFDGVSYACAVICNGVEAVSHEGIWDGFAADVTGLVRQGLNELTVKVIKPDFDKESPYFFRSVLFGFIPDVMLPFGGIWKDVFLEVKGRAYFEEIRCRFDTEHGRIVTESRLAGSGVRSGLVLSVSVRDPDGNIAVTRHPHEELVAVDVGNVSVWSPSSPSLYEVEVRLMDGENVADVYRIKAGFRRIEVRDGEIAINGEPFYMRGVIHWGCYPEKFAPNPTYDEVKDELIKLKAAGFNAVKHCLYFPPSYYYELCDEMGIVTWQELPLWLPYANERMLPRIYEQYPKMLKLFMHYPSVSLVSLGCELDATIEGDTLNALYAMVKAEDRAMIICDNSGSGECFEGVSNSSSDIYDYHFYAELYHLDGLINEFTRSYRDIKPWLFGEYNDADTYRLTRETREAFANAWWVDSDERVNPLRQVHKGFGSDQPIYHQEAILDRYGIAEEANQLRDLSYRQMHSIRKHILELTRSYDEIKGYNITTIKDVPITTSGIFDDKMNPKIDPESLRKVNGDIVLSFNKDLTRIWDNGADRFLNKDMYNYFSEDTVTGRITLSNRGADPLEGEYEVTLREGDRVLFRHRDVFSAPKHRVRQIAQLAIKLPTVNEVARCELSVKLVYADGEYSNEWDLWLYPRELNAKRVHLFDPAGCFAGIDSLFRIERLAAAEQAVQLGEGDILLTTAFDEKIESLAAERGIGVLFVQKGEGFFPLTYNPFYRESVKKVFDHPATADLKHLGYAGMQFYGVGTDRYFDKLEAEKRIGSSYTPIVRRYDARKFAAGDYLLEYRKGKGRFLATTLNLDGGQGSQPHSFKHNVFAIRLLHEIVSYLEVEAQGGA